MNVGDRVVFDGSDDGAYVNAGTEGVIQKDMTYLYGSYFGQTVWLVEFPAGSGTAFNSTSPFTQDVLESALRIIE